MRTWARVLLVTAIFGIVCVAGGAPHAVVWGCDDETTCPHNASTMIVSISLPLTGALAASAEATVRGYQFWASSMNAKGGVKGAKIELRIVDDTGKPETLLANYAKAITQDKVDVIFGPRFRHLAIPAIDLAEKYQYPALVPTAVSAVAFKSLKWPVPVLASLEAYASGVAETATELGIKRIAIARDERIPADLVEDLKLRLRSAGRELSVDEPFRSDESDFGRVSAAVRNSGAEGLVVLNVSVSQAIGLTRAIRSSMSKVALLVVWQGADSQQFVESVGDQAASIFRLAAWHNKARTTGNGEFVKRFREFVRKADAAPDEHVAVAFATGQILESAVQGVRDGRWKYLREALHSLKTSTVIGQYAIGEGNVQIGHRPLIIQLRRGEEEVVWPKELASARIRKE